MFFKDKRLYTTFFIFLIISLIPLWVLDYIKDRTYPWKTMSEFPLLTILLLLIIFGISCFVTYFDKKNNKLK